MYRILYIELKTGHQDDGPAWIGKARLSKSGSTVYFNDHAFCKYHGVSGNYLDIETSEEYWISGVKKGGLDRHWSGHGKVTIDAKIVGEYLALTGQNSLDVSKLEVSDIPDVYPIKRIQERLNGTVPSEVFKKR